MGEGGKEKGSSAAAETGVAGRGVWPCCCCNCCSSSAAVKGAPSPRPRASSSSPVPATAPASDEEEEEAAGTAVLMPWAANSASSASGSWKSDEIGTDGSGGRGTGGDELVGSGDCRGAADGAAGAAGAAEASAAATALNRCSVPGPAAERILPADCAGEVSAEAGVEVTLALPAPPLRRPRLFRSRNRSKSPPTRSTTSAAMCLSSRWRALAVASMFFSVAAIPMASADDLRDREDKVAGNINATLVDLDQSSGQLVAANNALGAAQVKLNDAQDHLAKTRGELAVAEVLDKQMQAKLNAAGANPDLSNKALRPLQDLKARVASQTSIAQILLLQGQGGDVMDEAINLVEAAAAKAVHQVASPGDTSKPVQTGQPNVPTPVVKTTRLIRAADFSSKTYLETEADVDAFVVKLKAELMAAVRAGQIARIQ